MKRNEEKRDGKRLTKKIWETSDPEQVRIHLISRRHRSTVYKFVTTGDACDCNNNIFMRGHFRACTRVKSWSKWRRWIIPVDLNDNRSSKRRLSASSLGRYLFARFFLLLFLPHAWSILRDEAIDVIPHAWHVCEQRWPEDYVDTTGSAEVCLYRYRRWFKNSRGISTERLNINLAGR